MDTWNDLARKYYPDLTDRECSDLLMGGTCFPLGDADEVEKQLKELKDNTDGTLEAGLAWAEKQFMEQWEAVSVSTDN